MYGDSGSWSLLPVEQGHPQCLDGAPQFPTAADPQVPDSSLASVPLYLGPKGHFQPTWPLPSPVETLCGSLSLEDESVHFSLELQAPSPHAPLLLWGCPLPSLPLILSLPISSCPLLASANPTHPQVSPRLGHPHVHSRTYICTLTHIYTHHHAHTHLNTHIHTHAQNHVYIHKHV